MPLHIKGCGALLKLVPYRVRESLNKGAEDVFVRRLAGCIACMAGVHRQLTARCQRNPRAAVLRSTSAYSFNSLSTR